MTRQDQVHSEHSQESQRLQRRDALAERFLAFSLCDEEYAVPLHKVKEVIALTEITEIPRTPSHFKGIMNLRGQVVSIIDLRLKLKLKKADITPESAIVILDLAPLSLGVIVDSVDSVLAAEGDELKPPPEFESDLQRGFITGIVQRDKKLVLILDIDTTISADELKLIKEQQTRQSA